MIDIDYQMWKKGYRFKLMDVNGKIEPMYAKQLMDIGPLMRAWPEDRFDIISINFVEPGPNYKPSGFIVGSE